MDFAELNNDFIWLQNIKSNDYEENTVIEKWNKTFDLRKIHNKQNKDIFTSWTPLRLDIGKQLVICLHTNRV